MHKKSHQAYKPAVCVFCATKKHIYNELMIQKVTVLQNCLIKLPGSTWAS